MSYTVEGFNEVKPVIKKGSFTERGKFSVFLEDGREVICPVNKFPSIKKLSANERNRTQIISGEGFTFRDCDEVFHLEQLLGDYGIYRYVNPYHRHYITPNLST